MVVTVAGTARSEQSDKQATNSVANSTKAPLEGLP